MTDLVPIEWAYSEHININGIAHRVSIVVEVPPEANEDAAVSVFQSLESLISRSAFHMEHDSGVRADLINAVVNGSKRNYQISTNY